MKDNTIKDIDGNSTQIYANKIMAMADDYVCTMLNDLWDIYTALCYKYNSVITIERYCILINISRETFYSWYKGETKNEYCAELGSSRSDTIKKWDRESELSIRMRQAQATQA